MCCVLVLGLQSGVQYGEVGRKGALREWCSARDRESESPSQPKAPCLSLKAERLQADQYRWRLRVHLGTDQTRSDHRLLSSGLLHCQKCPAVRVGLLFPMKHTDFFVPTCN